MNYDSVKPKYHIVDTSPTKTKQPFSLMEKVHQFSWESANNLSTPIKRF